MCRSVSPTYLFSSSGPLMLRKYDFSSAFQVALATFLASELATAFDQRLAAPGRTVEQHALGRTEVVLAEQVGVQVRQLDRIADLVDLP